MSIHASSENLAIIQTIDYLLKKLRYRYDKEKTVIVDDEDIEEAKKTGEFYPPDEILCLLRDAKMLEVQWKERKFFYEEEYRYSKYDTIISYIDTLSLFEYKRKLL